MTDGNKKKTVKTIDKIRSGLDKRYTAERRFRRIGQISILSGFVFLAILLFSIVGKGYGAFLQTYVELDIHYDETLITADGSRDIDSLSAGDYAGVVKASLREMFPSVKKRKEKRALYKLASSGAAFQLREQVMDNPDLIGTTAKVWVPMDDDADMFFKGHITPISRSVPEKSLSVSVNGKQAVLKTDGMEFSRIGDVLKQHLHDQRHDIEDQQSIKQEQKASRIEELNQLQQQHDEFTHIGKYEQAERVKEQMDDTAIYIEQHESELKIFANELQTLKSQLQMSKAREALSADMPSYLIAVNGGYIRLEEVGEQQASGQVLVPVKLDGGNADDWKIIELETPQSERRVKDAQAAILLSLLDDGRIHKRFNTTLFTAGDSREPELAGIHSALMGTMYMLIVTLLLSFPIGAAAAIYLEEFAPQNRWTDLIEVNINNLAAVP
ncbi:MAG: DUF3333 domain-containing protein, partial [Gammaproteobacteria bacterium]|nr:DUF3333 domain-containing protein [Gammaproteobacteria bacterium]